MASIKLTNDDIKKIQKLLKQGHSCRELAKRFKVSPSVISRRGKAPYHSRCIPLEIKNKVIKAIKDGCTKTEAAQMYNLPIGSVKYFTKGLPSSGLEGNHIIRQHGIRLLNRLITDGYLISDFVVPTVRSLQRHFPIIRCARYKDKTFFYLPGREQETIEAFFREKPDRVFSYYAIEEMAYLLGVQISKHDQKNLLERFSHKHADYWRSRRLIQRSIFDWVDDSSFVEEAEPSFRLMPQHKGERWD